MEKKGTKLYNLIFPIWLLWFSPLCWILVLPANYYLDFLVILLTLKYLNVENSKEYTKEVIMKVWLFGFLADIIGTFLMFLPNLIDLDSTTAIGRWWYDNLIYSVCYDPFSNFGGFLWIAFCLLVSGFLIYFFNRKISLKKSSLPLKEQKTVCLSLAIFTTPYLFLLPTKWFYR